MSPSVGPVREHAPAAQAQDGLVGDHELVVRHRQQQPPFQQPARGGGVRIAGEAAVADAHDRDRAGRLQRLVEQAPGGLVGLTQHSADHRGVGQGAGHSRDQLRLGRGTVDAQVPGHGVELVSRDPDLGQLGH
jgi:hypothetical protein